MIAAKSTALLLTGALLTALAGCATTHGRLSSSADRLEENAHAFATDSRYSASSEDRSSELAHDAHELADSSHEFRRAINDRHADDRDVKDAFDQVSHDYHSLRDDVDHSDSPDARADLRPVTQAYLDVERDMEGYSGHGRYAEGDRGERY